MGPHISSPMPHILSPLSPYLLTYRPTNSHPNAHKLSPNTPQDVDFKGLFSA